jgi:uncharacterized membrane protein
MDDLLELIIVLVVLAFLIGMLILPIVALVISIQSRKKLTAALQLAQQLTQRVTRLEAALRADKVSETATEIQPAIEQPPVATTPPQVESQPPPTARPVSPPPPISQPPPPPPFTSTASPRKISAEQIESVIGRRWLGWAAVALILFATAFFLKYAFDNRWIGELGRVTIGVAAGVSLNVLGFRYHRRGWRIFSQILTAGGVVLLYLSAYAAFGYYHLATQQAAFVYLAILISEAAALALLYNAPAIAVMALIGGFLNPILLRSDRDQYQTLFAYILALDVGVFALLKRWWGLSSLAYFGTHLLFWMWYGERYHPRKLFPVMVFQSAVFLIFFLSHLGRRLLSREKPEFEDLERMLDDPLKLPAIFEDLALLLINPFIFFATSYYLLNPNHHEWMGVFAIGMALGYAGAAKLLLDRSAIRRSELLLIIGIALTFVTLAIPIQLKSNWITIGWAVEALVILWVGLEARSLRLRIIAHVLFGLTLLRLVFWDTPFGFRETFTPVFNKYFLSSLMVAACLFGAAIAYKKVGARKQIPAPRLSLAMLLIAIITLWAIMSVETETFFAARARLASRTSAEEAQHQWWLGQMALSVLWSAYAAVLAAIGFIRRAPAIRWTALSLFALTVIKVMLVDIAVLQQLYRIIAFLVLGVLLLVVTWGYHKAFHSEESSK